MAKKEITDLKQIGHVVFTELALHTLEELQESSNERLNEYIEQLGDAVCFFAQAKAYFANEFEEQCVQLIEQITFIRADLKNLKKP